MPTMFQNDAAFTPFFDELVAVEGKRSGHAFAGSFRCCVLEQGNDELLSDGSTSADRRRITVSIARRGENAWPADGSRPQIGDVVKRTDGSTWKVCNVSLPLAESFDLEARES